MYKVINRDQSIMRDGDVSWKISEKFKDVVNNLVKTAQYIFSEDAGACDDTPTEDILQKWEEMHTQIMDIERDKELDGDEEYPKYDENYSLQETKTDDPDAEYHEVKTFPDIIDYSEDKQDFIQPVNIDDPNGQYYDYDNEDPPDYGHKKRYTGNKYLNNPYSKDYAFVTFKKYEGPKMKKRKHRKLKNNKLKMKNLKNKPKTQNPAAYKRKVKNAKLTK